MQNNTLSHPNMAFSKMGFGVGKSRAFDFEKAMLIQRAIFRKLE